MPTKKQIKSAKKLKRARRSKTSFPELTEQIVDSSDIILEVLDSRFIQDTRNYELEKKIAKKNKKIIYVLNKSDIVNKLYANKLKISPYVSVSCKLRKGIKKLRDKIKRISKEVKSPLDKSGKIIVGVIGYPNTGKSSLINLLIGKKSAGTGSEAGFTRGIQKLKLSSDIVLIDTPGVIPKEEYSTSDKSKISKNVEVGGKSYTQIKEPEIVVARLMKEYSRIIEKYYKINSKGDSEFLLETLGRKLNYLKKGGEVNLDKTARKILKDWQQGEIRIF